jgi:hypothetical protein
MSVIAKRRKKNIQAIEYLDKEKEVVRRVRKRKNATKNALDNGDLNVKEVPKRGRMSTEKKALKNGALHMNGMKIKSGEEAVVMKIPKRGRG